MELRIYIRHTQYKAFETDAAAGIAEGDNIVFVGQNTSTLKPVKGNVPKPNWIDVTDSVANLDKLSITWTTNRDADGSSIGGLNSQKSASGSLLFEDYGYHIIKDWLVNNMSAPLNSIDVKIEDVGCGIYNDFVIKAAQINWCENDICEFDITLQQRDETWHCIQKTLITDNWQGWFQHTPANGKKHPRFMYCNEARPSFLMIMLWWISTIIFTVIYLITPIVNTIIAIIGVIKTIIDVIKWIAGKDVDFKDNFKWFDPADIMKSFYTESSGCGFLHPAPLIRDYISNVCKKCGVEVDAISAPIFFSQKMRIDTSADRVVRERDNPYYNACYMPASVVRGIRMYKHLFGEGENKTQFWKEANAPLFSLDMFLDEIKGIFNCEWRIGNHNGKPTLYFWRKDWFTNGKMLYDFTKYEDRIKILSGVCYNWNDIKMPTYIRGVYNEDGGDRCGDEARKFMNDFVSINSRTNNFNFEGVLDKTSTMTGATKFRLDGVSKDYIADGIQVIYNGAVLTPTIPAILEESVIPTLKRFDYALLLSGDTASMAKILIWDGESYEYARAIRTKRAHVNGKTSLPTPLPNPLYNPQQKEWNELYEVETSVTGNKLTWGQEVEGNYQVKRTPFNSLAYERAALLVNYPMYFSARFQGNLFDWFHWIDDPNVNPKMNMQWSLKIDLCCEDIKKLGLMGGTSDVMLLQKVKIPNQYYSDGLLTEITISYDGESNEGRNIELKGTL